MQEDKWGVRRESERERERVRERERMRKRNVRKEAKSDRAIER